MKTIDVDLDVFKRLTNLLETTEDSYSEVIRRLLRPTNVRSGIWSVSATTPAANSQGSVAGVDASRSETDNVIPGELPDIVKNAMLRAEVGRQGSVAGVDASRSETDSVIPSELPAIVKNAILRAEVGRIDLPKGTELRARYKGNDYIAYVIDGRTLALNENRYSSLSGAAMAITHSPVSGYAFWKIRDPNTQRWIRLTEYKRAEYKRAESTLLDQD